MKIGGLQEWNPGAHRINPNTLKSCLGLQRLLCRETESEVMSQGEGVKGSPNPGGQPWRVG